MVCGCLRNRVRQRGGREERGRPSFDGKINANGTFSNVRCHKKTRGKEEAQKGAATLIPFRQRKKKRKGEGGKEEKRDA